MQMTDFAYGTRLTKTSNCYSNGVLQSHTSQDGEHTRLCTTQLFALDTSCPSRGTTGHDTVRGFPEVLPFEVYSQAPLRLIIMVQLRAPKNSQTTPTRISHYVRAT